MIIDADKVLKASGFKTPSKKEIKYMQETQDAVLMAKKLSLLKNVVVIDPGKMERRTDNFLANELRKIK